MAKLPALASGLDLVQSGKQGKGLPYGKHPNITVSVFDRAAYIYDAGKPLASVRVGANGNGIGAAVLRDGLAITTQSVPYVNAFVEGTGQFVVKNWRAPKERPEYMLRTVKGVTVPSAPMTITTASKSSPKGKRTAKPVAVTAAPVSVETGPVITVANSPASAATSALRGIPGVEFPARTKVKGAGTRGWTLMGRTVIPTTDYEALLGEWQVANDPTDTDVAAVLITGPAGTAKTMAVKDFAGTLGVPYLKVDGGTIRTADDWSGAYRQDAQTKVWAHRWSPFAQVLKAEEPCIIHIDELTRAESPMALNALLGFMDETGTLNVPDANAVLRMPKGILIIASANIGPEFVGTLPIDGAVRQRFPLGMQLNYPPAAIEAKLMTDRYGLDLGIAQGLVRLAAMQRKDRDNAQMYPSGSIISTRILLYIAKRIAKGNRKPREVIASVLAGQFEPWEMQNTLSVVIDSQFPKNGTLPTATAQPGDDTTIIADRHYFVAGAFGSGVHCEYLFPGTGTNCGKDEPNPIHISR